LIGYNLDTSNMCQVTHILPILRPTEIDENIF